MTEKGNLLEFKRSEDSGGYILKLRNRLRIGGAEIISIVNHRARGDYKKFDGQVLHMLSFRMFLLYIYELIQSGNHPKLSSVKFMWLIPDDQAIFRSFYSPDFDYNSFLSEFLAYENTVCDFHKVANIQNDEKIKDQADTRYAFMHWIMDLLNERVNKQ